MRKFLSLLLLLVLCLPVAATADGSASIPYSDTPFLLVYQPFDATDEQFAAANLFLSNFTEVGVDSIDTWYDDETLVDFAHDHIWFNNQKAYEFGEYFGDNNCRVSDKDIQRIINNYFYDAPQVNLSRTRFDYRGGYYYHCETGGWTNCGFARVTSIVPLGDDNYFVSFMVFGGGNHWENSVMSAPIDDIIFEFGTPHAFGSAQLYAKDLSDRSTYKMISYSVLR